MRARRLLVVAGSDSSGGAGVHVDRETALAFDALAHCVVTANTVQDDRGVHDLGERFPDEWLTEACAALEPRPDALKFGLLPGRGHIGAAAKLIDFARSKSPNLPVVVDPVITSSSGFTFLDEAGLAALCGELASRGVIFTPNLDEAAALAGMRQGALENDVERRVRAAHRILALGAYAVIIKGGHGAENPVRDLVAVGGGGGFSAADSAICHWIVHDRVPTPPIRGSGCRHATAVAAALARGQDPVEAARAAATHVTEHLHLAARARGAGY